MVFVSHIKTKDTDVTIFLYMQAGLVGYHLTLITNTHTHIHVHTDKGICVQLMGTHTIRKGRFCRKQLITSTLHKGSRQERSWLTSVCNPQQSQMYKTILSLFIVNPQEGRSLKFCVLGYTI